MSPTFEEILKRKLGHSTVKPTVPANLFSTIEQKGLDLKATLELRMESEVDPEEIEEKAFNAASRRIDDIIEGIIRNDILDHTFFTSTRKTRKRGKVKVPGAVYGLRDAQGRILSGLGLARLLNLVLYLHVQSLMGKNGRLVNRTGRFAHSAHINGVKFQEKMGQQRKNRVSIFYSYMTAPYEIFETTEPWAKGGARSPSKLISQAIQLALRDILNPTSFKANIFNIEEKGR